MKSSVFIDSNVWFSAFYKEGACSRILKQVVIPDWNIVISEIILEEIVRNFRLKIPKTLPIVLEYIQKIKPVVIKNPSASQLYKYRELAEKHDLPILVSAIEYGCTYFLTGNLKDFNITKIKQESKIILISPKEFQKIAKSKQIGVK